MLNYGRSPHPNDNRMNMIKARMAAPHLPDKDALALNFNSGRVTVG